MIIKEILLNNPVPINNQKQNNPGKANSNRNIIDRKPLKVLSLKYKIKNIP